MKKMLCCILAALLLVGCGSQASAAEKEETPAHSSTMQPYAGIPCLYIDGDIDRMEEKSDVRKVAVRYRDAQGDIAAFAKLKIQGNSSLYYEKKNYTITFYKDGDFEDKQKLDFGWGMQNKYCLKANWIDSTHARNIVSARLAAEVQDRYGVMEEAPNHGLVDGFPIEIYANGEFLGLYTLNLSKDAWLFGMDKDNENHLVFEGAQWADSTFFEEFPNQEAWAIEVGKESKKNMEKLSRLFKFVMDSSNQEFREDFTQYLDLDATLNYIILCELGLMNDNLGKNMLLATYDGLIWYPTLYDMDTTWGAHWTGLCLENYASMPVLHEGKRNYLFTRVETVYGEELAERYFELRQEILTQEHIMGLFNDFRAGIPEETWKREQERWQNIPGYDYDQIGQFLEVRLPLMDYYMEQLLEKAEARRIAEDF